MQLLAFNVKTKAFQPSITYNPDLASMAQTFPHPAGSNYFLLMADFIIN